MSVSYDNHYQTENLFGDPYPELIEFFDQYPQRGRVVDLGCGQGRNALAIARLGYEVTGIDHSVVGIKQMNRMAQQEGLQVQGLVGDIYAFNEFDRFDFVLLDSIFHFTKENKSKEIALVKRLLTDVKTGCLLVVCLQDVGRKVQILNQAFDLEQKRIRLLDRRLKYTFKDKKSGHHFTSDYRMIVVRK